MTAIPHPSHELTTDDANAGEQAHAHELSFIKKYIFSTDHKTIGLQFLLLGMVMFVIGGSLAMVVRWQLAWPSAALQKNHTIPILGRALFPTYDADAPLGTVMSVDIGKKLVIIGQAALKDAALDKPVKLIDAAGRVVANAVVTEVGRETVTASVDSAEEFAAVKVGAKATGKIVAGPISTEFYFTSFTMHATIMIFFVIIPLLVGTYGNYLIPLQIGTADMAFPFLNGWAFWSAVPAGALILTGFFLKSPAVAGWTSYPPLSAIAIEGGAWPLIPIVMNFAAVFMAAMFVCSHQVRVRSVWIPTVIAAAVLSLGQLLQYFTAGGIHFFFVDVLPAKPIQSAIVESGIYLGFVLAGSLIAYRLGRITLAIVISSMVAFFAVRGLQHAAFDGQSAWFLSVFILGFSSILGAVNYLTTIIKLRCSGMTMFRLPLSIWSLFITSIIVLLATPVLASLLLMNLLDHHRITTFFLASNWITERQLSAVAGGGFPLLHQHLFWFYSHPAVYIMILPAMGMVSDIMAAFARKPVFGYRPMVYALTAIAFLGFIVWAHHMFQSGMNPTLGTTFAISTMFIAVPSAIKTFNWLGTIWGGNIRFSAAMLCCLAFVAQFVIGGLSGIFMASTAVDVPIHDTYFIVAHIHYVLFGGTMFGVFAAVYFWYPKMFGRMMNEKLGKVHFWISFVAFNCTFFPMHILGLSGFPRRISDFTGYTTYGTQFLGINQFITYSAFVMGAAQIVFAINFLGSWFWGRPAGKNPWEATTLEWTVASPPPHGNFEKVPVVHHGPYEYSSPLVEEDWLPQNKWVDDTRATVAH